MKRKLLLMAAMVLTGLSSAWAAILPTSGSGEYLLRNVQTGTYLKGDAYYGTKTVVWDVPYFLTLTYVSDGVYTIKTQQNNGGEKQYIGSGADPYVDSPVCNMTFTEVDATNHYYTINNGSGNLYAIEQTEDGTSFYKVMAGSETGDNAKWQLISRDEMVSALDAASPSNPVDASFLIYDAAFDTKSVNDNKWTKSNVDLAGGGNAGHNAESWNKSSFSISQNVTGLPNGKYKATCYGYYRWNNGGNNNNAQAVAAHDANDGTEKLNAIFFAGDKEEPLMSVAGDAAARSFCASMTWADNTPNSQWQAAACFTQGFYLNTIENILVTDGTLNIGVKKTTQAGTDWCVFDEFKLYYLGVDLDAYKTTLATKRSEANDILTSDVKLNAEVKSALQTAYTNTASVEETKTALEAAIALISGAITHATASIDIYEEAKAILDAANAFDATGQASYAAHETIAAIQAAYDNGTLETLTNEQKAAAQEALSAACKAQAQPADNSDMSACIQNWDFLNCENNNYPGWTISKTAGYANKFGTTAVEYWNGTASKGGFDYYQTITGLPTGVYTIQGNMWNSTDNEEGATGVNGQCGVYGKSTSDEVFGGVTVDTRDGGKATYSTQEIIVVDGRLRLGIKNNATMGGRWFGVDWIKLTYARQMNNEEATEAYNKALDAAQAIVEGTIPSDAWTLLQGVITNNKLTEGTAAQYAAAATALNAAATAAAELKEPYATWLALKGKAEALAENHPTISGAIAKVSAAVEKILTADLLNQANEATESLMYSYVAWDELLAYANLLKGVNNDNDDANQTLRTAITTQSGAISTAYYALNNNNNLTPQDVKELNDAVDGATAALKAAMITYAGVANPVGDGAQFDLTFMLTNPDLTQYWDGTWWIQPAGWFKDQTDGNFQVMNNGSVDAEDGVHTIFMEYYYLNNSKTYDNGKFNIYTKATLPAGTYTMNCYAFAKEENYSSGNPNPQVFFYANDTQGSKVNSNKLTEQSISFINETEQEVKIGLKPLGGNTYNWMGIGYVKLYKEYTDNNTYAINVTPTGCNVVVTVDDVEVTETKATKTVTLTVTPNKEYESSSVTVTATYNDGENVMDLDVANPSEGVYTYPQPAYDVNVTVTYEYLANMNITDAHYATFIAPFDVEIPDGVTAYTVNESKGEMLLMEPITGNIYGTIYANTPVVLYSEDAMSQDFKGQSTAEKDAYTEGLLTGTYVSMNKDALDGKYILQKHEGDETPAFYKVDATKEAEPSLAPNRCYLTDTNNSSKLRFSFGDEEATAINGLEVLTSGKYDAIYNAAGVKVNALQKGMNIIQKSGKTYKIFVK